MASNFDVAIVSFTNNLHFNNSIYSRKCFNKFSKLYSAPKLFIVYRNTWLGKMYYARINFCYSTNMLNTRSRGSDRVQYCVA